MVVSDKNGAKIHNNQTYIKNTVVHILPHPMSRKTRIFAAQTKTSRVPFGTPTELPSYATVVEMM
jgi:hypothetical protein